MSLPALSRSAFVLLLLASHCYAPLGFGAELATDQCPAPETQPDSGGRRVENYGALASLLGNARSTRNGILNQELPYEFIRTEFSKVYDGADLDIGAFVEQWLKYLQNALFLAGFVTFLALVLPGAMVALWVFWECCYEKNEEEEEEDNRNLTLKAQVISWLLVVFLLLLLLGTVVFVAIFLAGDIRVRSGVQGGSQAVGGILGELAAVKKDSLERVDRIVLHRYDELTEELNRELYRSSETVTMQIEVAFGNMVRALTSNVIGSISRHGNLLEQSRTLRDAQSRLQQLGVDEAIESLRLDLAALKAACTVSADSGSLCSELVTNSADFVPELQVDLAGLGGGEGQVSYVEMMVRDLSSDTFEPLPLPSDSTFIDYLHNLNLTIVRHISDTSEQYFGTIRTNLTRFTENVNLTFDSALTFGLPHSQDNLDAYLSPRYLGNWEEFRHALSATFAAVLVLMTVCLGAALCWGLFNVSAIFRYGEDSGYIKGAHHAGLAIKRLAFGFCAVTLVTAATYGFFFCIGAVLGRVCGPQDDLMPVMENIVDSPDSWSGDFPFGKALIGDASYPLTVGTVLEECRMNQSLFPALHLGRRYDLEAWVRVDPDKQAAFIRSSKLISEALPPASLLGARAEAALGLLEAVEAYPVGWGSYTELTSTSLFQASFRGTTALGDLLLGELAGSNLSSLAVAANASLSTLVASLAAFENLLPTIHTSAGYLEREISLSDSSLLLLHTRELETSVMVKSAVTTNTELAVAAKETNDRLAVYEEETRFSIHCSAGFCHSLAVRFDQFTESLCLDVVPGMDLYWTSLVALLVFSLLTIPAAFFLASRFIDLVELGKSDQSGRIHLTSAILEETRAAVWLGATLAIDVWLVVVISRDEVFSGEFCQEAGPGCCATCVWAFGILFLILASFVGGVSRVYQGVIMYRIKKCENTHRKHKVRRFWTDRRKAVQFYTQLGILLLLDIPFLILAGTYTQSSSSFNVPVFFAILASLLGILTYLLYLLRERNNIQAYLSWLRGQLEKLPCADRVRGKEGVSPEVQGPAHVPPAQLRSYGNSESEHSDDSGGTYHNDSGFEFLPGSRPAPAPPTQRLSDIVEEGGEGGEELREGGLSDFGRVDDTEFNEPRPMSILMLDREVDPQSEDFITRREEGVMNRNMGGVEIARPYYRLRRHLDDETTTSQSDSFLGSRDSMSGSEMTGYYSSSQAPDYESSMQDDYDGGESAYSQQIYRLRTSGLVGEMSVEV